MRIHNLLYMLMIMLMACQSQQKEQFDVLIINASIVDVSEGKLFENQLIAINNDTIRLVGDMAMADHYEAGNTIDATGKFVIPGLWDNHVHFRGGDSLIQENKNLLPLFLAHGITTIRDAGGDITPAVMGWKEAIANGRLSGPRIFSSGPKLDGTEPAWAGSISVTDSASVAKALDSLESIHADYVKMYDGNLTKEAYYSIIRQAEARGLNTTGHMPLAADVLEAAAMGLDGTEHLYYVLKSCSPKADSLTNLGYGVITTLAELAESYDPQLAKAVFKDLATNDFYVTPTLYIGGILSQLADDDHVNDELLKYIGSGIQKTYERRIESAKRAKISGNDMRSRLAILFEDMVKPMHDAGINVLAGSDCGPYNSFVYPGESLHRELERLVDAELSPQEALKTSIINGPKFFGVTEYYGSVAEGRVGDLLILDENPLEDIQNTQSIYKVIMGDTVYDKATLDGLLEQLLSTTNE